MSGGWVAVGVRARGMARRRLSSEQLRAVAAGPSLEDGLVALASSRYAKRLYAGQTLEQAQRSVTGTLLWNLRVLAGWAPAEGVTQMRALAGVLEIDNVTDHVRRLAGMDTPSPYRLGALATTWPRLERTGSPEELGRALSASPWGDPGGWTANDIAVSMRASLYDRLLATVPQAAPWAEAAAVLLIGREVVLAAREIPRPARRSLSRVIGWSAVSASTWSELARRAPRPARWVLSGVSGPADLWAAEARWWARLAGDGATLMREPTPGADTLVGAVALMAHDAWRAKLALELAGRAGRPPELLDAAA